MDHALFSDGSVILFDLETRLEEKEGENGWLVLSGTIGTEFYLVADLLWTQSSFVRTYCDCGHVGVDRDDDEEVLSLIKVGALFAGTISAVG